MAQSGARWFCQPGATVYWTQYGYDALGRTTSITLPDGSVSSYSYSGNTTTVTDPAGKWYASCEPIFRTLS